MNYHKYTLSNFISRHYNSTEDFLFTKIVKALPFLYVNTGPWLAGGSVRRIVSGEDVKADTDFDIFFLNQSQRDDFIQDLEKKGAKLISEREHVKNYSFPIPGTENHKVKIQIVFMKYYTTAEEVLDYFDFTICQCLTDGETLLVGEYTLWDLARKRLAINRVTYGVSTLRRLLKYSRQGFNACSGALATILEQVVHDPSIVQREVEYVD